MQHRPRKKTRFQATTLIAGVVVILILFISVGYFFTITERPPDGEQQQVLAALRSNNELWQINRPASYNYIVERDCVCPAEYTRPYAVTVDRGVRTASYVLTTDEAVVGATKNPPEAVWLDDLFMIATRSAARHDKVDVIFDPRFGYPSSVTINSTNTAIGRFAAYRVRDFEVIEYN